MKIAQRCAAVGAFLSILLSFPVGAQTVAPEFAADYTVTNLGSVVGVPGSKGGLTIDPKNPNRLLIGGNALTSSAKIYAVEVVRDPNGHITGFAGSAVEVAQAPGGGLGGIDGGLAFGPDGVLFYSTYGDNYVGQIKPGSTAPNKLVALGPLGMLESTGGLTFVPPGFPGAGRLKLTTYSGSLWYDAEVEPDGSGTFNIVNLRK
jgi:hypothetical protein